MTELEKMMHAKEYIDKLAKGVDPLSDSELPKDTVLNNVRLSRCFFYVAEVLEKVIGNGGEVYSSADGKVRFVLTEEQKAQVAVSPEAIGVNELAKRINSIIDANKMLGVSGVKINDWLVAQGYLVQMISNDKKMKTVSSKGKSAGIQTIDVTTPDGRVYKKNIFNLEMQRYIVEHINEVNTPIGNTAKEYDEKYDEQD